MPYRPFGILPFSARLSILEVLDQSSVIDLGRNVYRENAAIWVSFRAKVKTTELVPK